MAGGVDGPARSPCARLRHKREVDGGGGVGGDEPQHLVGKVERVVRRDGLHVVKVVIAVGGERGTLVWAEPEGGHLLADLQCEDDRIESAHGLAVVVRLLVPAWRHAPAPIPASSQSAASSRRQEEAYLAISTILRMR
eukprot:scaffold1572_cov329-Prasinococcus_capsulatus_cf.AAC.7